VNVAKIISKVLAFASQGLTEDRQVGLPHEEALVSGFSNPELVGATLMFPSVDVNKESGEFREYGADGLQLIEGGIEMPIGETRKSIDIEVGKDAYRTVKMGLEAIVFDEEQETEDYDTIKERKLQNVAGAIQLYAESLVSKVVQNTSNFDTGFKVTFSTSTSRWSDGVNSDPSADIAIGCLALEDTHEVDRDQFVVAIAKDVWDYVVVHPKLQMVTTSGQKLPPTKEFLAQIWGVKEVRVARGKYSYNVGSKSDPRNWRFKRLWTNCFVIFRPIEKPNAQSPLWGAVVNRKGFPQVKPPFRDDKRDADVYPTNAKFGVLLRAKNRAYYADRVKS
jgi:hypothetical protein